MPLIPKPEETLESTENNRLRKGHASVEAATKGAPVSGHPARSAFGLFGRELFLGGTFLGGIFRRGIFRRGFLRRGRIPLLVATLAGGLPPLPPGEEIFDIRDPVLVPFPWLTFILKGLGLAILAWLAFRLVAWVFRPISREKRAPEPKDPLKEALDGLERLKRSQVWAERRVKDILEVLTRVLKVFLKDRFSLGLGLAATSDELLADMRRNRVSERLMSTSSELLGFCDRVKYAKGAFEGTSLEEMVARIRQLLLEEDWRP